MSEQEEQEQQVLEMDEEAAADTAPPADVQPPAPRKITLQEAWTWNCDELLDDKATLAAFEKFGSPFSIEKMSLSVEMRVFVGNVLNWMIENEEDLRSFMDSKNVVKLDTARPRGRRSA